MSFLAHHAERAAVFILFVMMEGVFWTPSTFFAGPNANLYASDPYSIIFYVALVGFLAVAMTLRAGAVIPLLRSAWPILPLICFAYLSAYWSAFPDGALMRTTKVAVTALFGIYLVSRGDLADLVKLFVKANLVACAASFAVFFLARKYAFSTMVGYEHAWRGAFGEKNALGIYAGLGILFAVYAFGKGYGSRLASGIAIPTNLLLLYLSQSKTPLVLLFLALYMGLLGLALRRRSGPGLAAAFVLLVFGVASAAIIPNASGDVLAALGRDATLTGRTDIWRVVMPYAERRLWLGYGFGAFWTPTSYEANQVWMLLNWKAPNAHNVWLQLLLDLGLVGCFLAALAWLVAIGRTIRLLFLPTHTEIVFSLALLTGILVESFTEYAFFAESLLWALFAAMLVYLGRELARAPRRAAVPQRRLGAPLLIMPVHR